MQSRVRRRCGIGAVFLTATLLVLTTPTRARAHWMGDAFNQSLVQAINQVMDLVIQAGQQDERVPGLNQALHQLVRALTHQGHGGKHHGHGGRRGFADGMGEFAGWMGGNGAGNFPLGGNGFLPPPGGADDKRAGHAGGPNLNDNNGPRRERGGGGFGAGLQQVGNGAGGNHRKGNDHVRVHGDNNLVIVGNQGNIVINGAGNAPLNAGRGRQGGAFGGGMEQLGACHPNGGRDRGNRQPAPMGDVVAMAGGPGAAKAPVAGPGMLTGQRRLPPQAGAVKAPEAAPVNGARDAALKPVGGMVGNRKPIGPIANAGKQPAVPVGAAPKQANAGGNGVNRVAGPVAAGPLPGGKIGTRVNPQVQGRARPNTVAAAPRAGAIAGAQVGQKGKPAGAAPAGPVANRGQPAAKVAGAQVGQRAVTNRAPSPAAGKPSAPRVGAPLSGALGGGTRAGAQVGAKASPAANKSATPRVGAPVGNRTGSAPLVNKVPAQTGAKAGPSRVPAPAAGGNRVSAPVSKSPAITKGGQRK